MTVGAHGVAGDERSHELAGRLAATRDRISAAAAQAGRSPDDITLLVVTKYFPGDDMERLLLLGEREFGESREPEASRKVAAVRGALPDVEFAVDMIGRVQRKKAGSVARWARRVHSADSLRLIEALAGAAVRAQDAGERISPLGVLLQVSLDGDPDRGGFAAADLNRAADAVLESAGALTLDGLMTIAPLDLEPEQAMAMMAQVRGDFLADHPDARELSAGMSGDLDEAIRHGSTFVRVGTAIMGPRPIVSL